MDMVLRRLHSLLSLSIDCHFSPRGRCCIVVLGLFFFNWQGGVKVSCSSRPKLTVAPQSRSYTLFKLSQGMCFATWHVSGPPQGVQPITVCRRQHEVGAWMRWAHFNRHLRRTLPLWSHPGLSLSFYFCIDARLLWNFLSDHVDQTQSWCWLSEGLHIQLLFVWHDFPHRFPLK